ncbi:alpha/beta fold hydrolase [Agarivorans sp.]|uniref:alpha/beta fold hydrolase n=1 Tax=Agarivorans sp. TaxID=1872412 RepID=UPI003CFFF48E
MACALNQRPIVLLRGLVREQRHWGAFKQLLQQRYPARPVLSFDVPGNGQLSHLPSAWHIAELRQSLRIQLRLCDVDVRNVDLLAISMGGMLALDWARAHPEEVHSMLLINPSNAAFSPFYQRLNYQSYLKLLGCIFARTAASRERRIMQLSSRFATLHQAELDDWCSWAEQCPVSLSNAFKQLVAAARFKLELAPSVPLLLLASRRDQLVNVRCSQVMAQTWGCELRCHPSAGHDLALDAPSWTCQQIDQWFASLEDSSSELHSIQKDGS